MLACLDAGRRCLEEVHWAASPIADSRGGGGRRRKKRRKRRKDGGRGCDRKEAGLKESRYTLLPLDGGVIKQDGSVRTHPTGQVSGTKRWGWQDDRGSGQGYRRAHRYTTLRRHVPIQIRQRKQRRQVKGLERPLKQVQAWLWSKP